jgi:Nuclease-related domain
MRVFNHPTASGRAADKLLGQYLDDRFTLVHHVRLPNRRDAIDGVLVGPHGVTVLALANDAGRVRCLGDRWYVWNSRIKDFVGAGHSPVKQAQSDRTAIEALLAGRGLGSVVPVDCAVLSVQPSAQVEFMQPATPIWPSDKIAGLARTLAGQRELVEWTLADDTLKALGLPPVGKPWRALSKPGTRAQAVRPRRTAGLQRQQIILLAAMAIADLLVLIGGLVIVLRMR